MTDVDGEHYATIARHALDRRHTRERSGPVLLGISGAVGVGKSTAAALVAGHLARLGATTEIVATDGFLLSSADLEVRGLTMRKGFPESYDHDLLGEVMLRLAAGDADVVVPLYSHETYDRVPGPGRALAPADVVIVEGVIALQPPVVEWLDIAVYVDADEDHLRAWFSGRFLELCAEADADPGGRSFYRAFAGMDERQRRELAATIWESINGVNLRDHIGPSRSRATHVVRKAADHRVTALLTT